MFEYIYIYIYSYSYMYIFFWGFSNLQITEYWKKAPERMTCHIRSRVGQFTDRGVKHLCLCMSLLCYIRNSQPMQARLRGCRVGGGGKRVRKFSYGSKQNQTRDEKVSDLHIANEKGSPTPCAGVMQNEKEGGGGKGGKKKKKARFRSG